MRLISFLICAGLAVSSPAFVQQREGSSRATTLWVAPKLHYLPARIERRKDKEPRGEAGTGEDPDIAGIVPGPQPPIEGV